MAIEDKHSTRTEHNEGIIPPFGKVAKDESESIWNDWTPVIYKFKWGYSATRGCLFAWFFFHTPYLLFSYCCGKACSAVYILCGSPKRDSGWIYLPMYVSWIPCAILAIIWIIVTIILFFPWLFCYIIGFIVDCILMLIYGITCCFICCKNEDKNYASWRSFTCSGWLGEEWNTGYDPYTEEIWEEWSPIRTLCSYNFPPV